MAINQKFKKTQRKTKQELEKKKDQKIKTIQKRKKRCVWIFKTWKKWFKDLGPKDHNDWNGEMLEQTQQKWYEDLWLKDDENWERKVVHMKQCLNMKNRSKMIWKLEMNTRNKTKMI